MRYGSLVPRVLRSSTSTPVSLIATWRPAFLFVGEAPGVQTGQQALCSGFFIPGSAVDLAGEEQPLNEFAFQRRLQIARIEEIVLDGVTGRIIRAFCMPSIERTICICTSNGRLVEIPLG